MSEEEHHFDVEWHDSGRGPQVPPNPQYPNGVDLDVSGSAKITCTVELPYPAKRCGVYVIHCSRCHQNVGITTAGRPDDPRSVKLACKLN